MAIAVPITLLGRDLVSCTVYAGIANADTGVITWGTGVDIGTANGNASYKGFAINSGTNTVDVTPSDGAYVANLNETYNLGFSVNQLQKGTGLATLETVWTTAGAEYLKVVMAYRKRGGAGTITYRVAAGLMNNISLPHDNGLNLTSITCISIGVPEYIGPTIPATFTS